VEGEITTEIRITKTDLRARTRFSKSRLETVRPLRDSVQGWQVQSLKPRGRRGAAARPAYINDLVRYCLLN
jgi:hypothetical protein